MSAGSGRRRRSSRAVGAGAGPRVLAPFGRRLCEVTAAESVGAYRLLGIEDPDGPEPACRASSTCSLPSEGWGSTAHGGRPIWPRLLRLPGPRTAARLPARGDRPGHGTARAHDAGRRRCGWSARSASASRSPPTAARAPLLWSAAASALAPLVIWAEALARARARSRGAARLSLRAHARAAELFACDVAARDRRRLGAGRPGPPGFVTELLERRARRRPGGRSMPAGRPRCSRRCGDLRRARSAGAARDGGRHGVRLRRLLRLRRARRATGYRRLCVDGPVVDAADLEEGWE